MSHGEYGKDNRINRMFRINISAIQIIMPVLSILLTLSLTQCRGFSARDTAVGWDYFSDTRLCTTGSLQQETDIRYLGLYQAYRQQFKEENRKSAFAVIAGDSIAALFVPERTQKYLPEFDIANRGIGGDTSTLFLQRFSEDIVPLSPKVIVLSIGGNDLLGGRCINSILTNIQSILTTMRSMTSAKILVMSIPPVLTWKANSIAPFYNEKLDSLVGAVPGASFIDFWPTMSEIDRPMLKQEFWQEIPGRGYDSVHFNERGYENWANLLRPELKKIQR